MSKSVLCLLADGFEEIETVTPVDLLRRAGVEVVMASLGDGIHVVGRNGIWMHADTKLADVDPASFDMLFIPGGPAVKALRADGQPAQLAREFAAAGKPVAAICAGPLVLMDAGLLNGKRHTAHDSTYDELPNSLEKERVVQDDGIITARGAGTALDFGLTLVRHLCGAEAADQVAAAVMA